MSWLSVKLGSMLLEAMKEAKKARDSDSMAEPAIATAKTRDDPFETGGPMTTFTMLKAANGRLIKVSEYRPTKSHHSDWAHEIYIVKDDEKVPDVITRIMAIKALET